jgi:hypothetical protein
MYLGSGFGLAAGIPFCSWYFRGIVLHLARPHADTVHLQCMENQVFFASSVKIVGYTLTCAEARMASLAKKQLDCAMALRKARKGILHNHRTTARVAVGNLLCYYHPPF